jgi:hypothetical protein
MFQNLKHRTEREENYKDMDLKSSKRGFHRSPGTNSSVVKGNETRLVRCVNCGFPCDRERDSRSPEDSWVFLGINYGSQLTASSSPLSDRRDSTGAQVADNYYERTMAGGCPSCGSMIYDKKPQEVNLP